jgi:sugar lactone lactonase YvrE
MAIGSHKLEYEVVQGWERLPEGWAFTEVVGVAVDSRERVFVFCRGPHPLIVFDKEGRFVDAWGAGRFVRPHGIFISPDDRVFLVDDEGHSVYEYSTQGELRRRLGDGQPSDTGYVPGRSPVARGAGPFNTVTNVALAPDGELYVADGYGNARVHRFAADGRLLGSWGEPGSGPGQFNLPHGIAVDRRGRVYVADRENSRVQIFSRDGVLLDIWDWPNRPCDLFIDADERLSSAGVGEIRAAIRRADDRIAVFELPRRNLVFGRTLKGGGWWPDHQARVMRPCRARYDPRHQVHEQLRAQGMQSRLHEPLINLNYSDWSEFHSKQRGYSHTLAADIARTCVVPARKEYVSAPLREFRRRFVILRGYRDGLLGMRLALAMSREEMRVRWLVRHNRTC